MKKIIFDETFSVGVRKLDEQHQKLIDLINTLSEMKDETVDLETALGFLTQMTEYADYHFSEEEQFMLAHHYKDYAVHKMAHNTFKKKTSDLLTTAKTSKQIQITGIAAYLRNWLVNHILTTDMDYKDFFNEKGLD